MWKSLAIQLEPEPEPEPEPAPSAGWTVRKWGAAWLAQREREGIRSVADDRARWRVHVEGEPWIDGPLSAVTRADARAWWGTLQTKNGATPGWKTRRPLGASTIRNVLNLVRPCFQDAMTEGLIVENPFAGLRLRRSRAARVDDAWTVIVRSEQERALLALAAPDRWIAAVAMGSMLRKGEQWALRLVDVHVDVEKPYLDVRFSAPGKPTKSGKPRRVPLFGLALWAMRLWLAQLGAYAPKNPDGLVFPTREGKVRTKTARVPGWGRLEKAVGRPVRWHDLRHTGATSLLAGWWCQPWSFAEIPCLRRAWNLEEISRICGHSSIGVTERYVHWLDENERLSDAARAMVCAVDSLTGESLMVDTGVESNGFVNRRSRVQISKVALKCELQKLTKRAEKTERERDEALRELAEERAGFRQAHDGIVETFNRLKCERDEARANELAALKLVARLAAQLAGGER